MEICNPGYFGPLIFTLGEGFFAGREKEIMDYCSFVLNMSTDEREIHHKCFKQLYVSRKNTSRNDYPTISTPTCRCKYCHHLVDQLVADVQYYQSLPPVVEANPISKKLGFVYIMKNSRNGYYKIGYSRHLKVREATLQAEDPDIKLIASRPGYQRDERTFHERFAELRIRGEWFRLSEEEVDDLVEEFAEVSA